MIKNVFKPAFSTVVAHLRAEIDRRGNARIVRAENNAPVWDGKYEIVNGWVVFGTSVRAPSIDAMERGITAARNAG